MTQNPHDVLSNIGNIRNDILRLCNAQGSETTDFHALGFDCLLKKLHEIEKILTGLKEMPITAHSTPHSARYQPVLTEPEVHVDRCQPEMRPNPERLELSLPDDLTPHTKRVLNDIYIEFEKSIDQFYEGAKLKCKQLLEDSFRKLDCYLSTFREKQKADLRIFIENALEDGGGAVSPPDSFFGELSYIPTQRPATHRQPRPPTTEPPMINMEAVTKTLECPGVDPRSREKFFTQLNGLNDILNDIMEQVDRRCPLPPRQAGTRPPPIPEVPSACEVAEEGNFQPLTCTR